jgi:Ca2+-binding RTX toxin-like protein
MNRRLTRALPVAALLAAGLAAPATAAVINGTSGPDVLVGTAGADTIRGFGGADRIYGKAGRDALYPGRGRDRVYGGRGADRIFASGNDWKVDRLYGGRGPDHIYASFDIVSAGYGNDVIEVFGRRLGMAIAEVDCGPGHDTLITHGHPFVNRNDCEHVIFH